MTVEVRLDAVYAPSDNIVAREIEGEIVIVPLVSGIGDMEDELYSMNETGKIIWDNLNGKDTLKDLMEKLFGEFDAPAGEIEKDVVGLVFELLKRKMVVEVEER